jgi:pyruvate dehydrogenase E2 component (dihydrolipoamide acetyltransferase)
VKEEFLLPDLGEGLEGAEVVRWLVAEGDRVELNQPLVEVNTEKAEVEIPSPFEGIVVRLHGSEGEVVAVGAPLVTIEVERKAAGPAEEAVTQPEPVAFRAETPAKAAGEGIQESGEAPPRRRPVLVGYGVADDEPTGSDERATASREAAGPVPATPPVRRLAKELGVDLGTVTGSGPHGRVTRDDVERAATGQADGGAGAPTGEVERIPVRGTRRLIAQKMARSAREIPHVTTFLTVDAHWLEAFRAELAEKHGQRVSALPIVVRALAEMVAKHRLLNASFDEPAAEIRVYRDCHVGVAVDTDRGLLVPVVRDVRSKGILEIGHEIGQLATAARSGSIRPEQMSGGTITVTNVGSFGAEFGTPIINQPEGAILATGVIEQRPLVVDGEVVARPAMTLSLSFDHRLIDGAEAGQALRDLGDFLESPFSLGSLPQ